MKTGTLLLCLWSFCLLARAQRLPVVGDCPNPAFSSAPSTTTLQPMLTAESSIIILVPDHRYMTVLSSGSILRGQQIALTSATPALSVTSFAAASIRRSARRNTLFSGLAVTRFGAIARGLHTLMGTSLREKANLRLCCQKAALGSSVRACKKVTGITFAIAIGK
jgi:hypothetical protein